MHLCNPIHLNRQY